MGRVKLSRFMLRYMENAASMKQWERLYEVESNPEKLGGAWVFRDTRVPVSALFENLRDGATIEEFLAWFPGVKRSQVEAVLNAD